MNAQVIVFEDLLPHADIRRLQALNLSLRLGSAAWQMQGFGYLLTLGGVRIVRVVGNNFSADRNDPIWPWEEIGCEACPIAECSNRDAQDWLRRRLPD